MTWPQAIFYSICVICATPVACLFVAGMMGIELRWGSSQPRNNAGDQEER